MGHRLIRRSSSLMMRKYVDQEADGYKEGSENDSESVWEGPADRSDRIYGDLYTVHHERRKQAD